MSLFAQDSDASPMLAGARVLPVDFELDETSAAERALELSEEARSIDGASIGVSLVFSGTRQDMGLVSGTVFLAIAKNNQPPRALTSLPVRSTLEEVQRRARLHAADMLRQELG